MAEGSVVISQRGVERIRLGHLWVYRSDVRSAQAEPGAVVRLTDERGRYHGRAFYSDKSQIAVRLLTREDRPAERAFFAERQYETYEPSPVSGTRQTTGYHCGTSARPRMHTLPIKLFRSSFAQRAKPPRLRHKADIAVGRKQSPAPACSESENPTLSVTPWAFAEASQKVLKRLSIAAPSVLTGESRESVRSFRMSHLCTTHSNEAAGSAREHSKVFSDQPIRSRRTSNNILRPSLVPPTHAANNSSKNAPARG